MPVVERLNLERGTMRLRLALAGLSMLGMLGCGGSGTTKDPPPNQTPTIGPASSGKEGTQTSKQSPSNSSAMPGKTAGHYLVDITTPLGIKNPTGRWPDGKFLTPEITPGGVAVFDYDNDGRLDILQICHQPPGQWDSDAPNRLYRQKNDGTFDEVPGAAGLADPKGYGHGVAIGDYDSDGWLDVYITNYGQDRLFRNNGNGTFADVTEKAGIPIQHRWGSSTAFLDYDRDGDLDLYACRFATFDDQKICKSTAAGSELDYCGPHTFPGQRDLLLRNNGDGTFTDVSEAAGIRVPARGWGVTCADLTGDGWIDIYVANDEEPAQLWVNQKNGTFVDEALFRGCAQNAAGRNEAGMGTAVGDFDNDGIFDLFKTHITSETNTLYRGLADRNYDDYTARAGMAPIDLPYTGWGCGFFDFDHDGWQDIAVVNGRVARGVVLPGADHGSFWNLFAEPKLLFRNNGKGQFVDVRDHTGTFASRPEVSRGLAFADLDEDGDLDLVANNIDNTLRVYRNDAPPSGSHWLMVRAVAGKRDAIGAQIALVAGSSRQVRVVQGSYSFLSSSDLRVHFGLGQLAKVDRLEVLWPDGQQEVFAVGGVDQHVTIRQGAGQAARKE